MMLIKNNIYQELSESDLLICVLGYETRSWFLLEKNLANRKKENTLVFCLDKHKQSTNILAEIEKRQIELVEISYDNFNSARAELLKFIKTSFEQLENLNIHIDYSSMPRSWYCSFPLALRKFITNGEKVSFWYVSGDYQEESNDFPSAGIDAISVFSGLSLPSVDIKRFHIIGLGYDSIRTETMISIIEPESLVSCYAYNPLAIETKESAYNANKSIIDRSLLSVALPIDNFSVVVDKLCELVYDFMQSGQVVVVPDGPKPLIMAMSLLPDIIKKDGLTCLHISRNSVHHNKIDVTPRRDEIYGFQITY